MVKHCSCTVTHSKRSENKTISHHNIKKITTGKISFYCSILALICIIFLSGCISADSNDSPVHKSENPNKKPLTIIELEQNNSHKNIISSLSNEGFFFTNGSISLTYNETQIEELYQTPDGKNATITSVIRNGTLEEVTVHKEEETPLTWYLGILLLLILTALCTYAGYRYYHTLSQENTGPENQNPEPADIREETESILLKAEKACSEGRMKDAYALAGQGMRYFLSYRLGSGTASTNDEIITLVMKSGNDSSTVQELLDTCMMVEFARSEGNREDFTTIIDTIRTILDRYSSDKL